MGSAIAVFSGARAVRVPRTRFAPVKTTADLLAVQSDRYQLTPEYRVVKSEKVTTPDIVVDLDPRFYKMIFDLQERFPDGPPSLVDCSLFAVEGDIRFGRDVVCRGEVQLVNQSGRQIRIADGTILQGTTTFG